MGWLRRQQRLSLKPCTPRLRSAGLLPSRPASVSARMTSQMSWFLAGKGPRSAAHSSRPAAPNYLRRLEAHAKDADFLPVTVCGEWLAASSERKQVEELIAAIRLLVAMPALTGARLESANRPDLGVHLGGHIYGLEVTRIVRGGPDMISRARGLSKEPHDCCAMTEVTPLRGSSPSGSAQGDSNI